MEKEEKRKGIVNVSVVGVIEMYIHFNQPHMNLRGIFCMNATIHTFGSLYNGK